MIVTVVPQSAFRDDLQNGILQAIPLEQPVPHRLMVLATRTDNANLPGIRHMVRIIRQSVHEVMGTKALQHLKH